MLCLCQSRLAPGAEETRGQLIEAPLKSCQKLPESATFFELIASPQLPYPIRLAVADGGVFGRVPTFGRKSSTDGRRFCRVVGPVSRSFFRSSGECPGATCRMSGGRWHRRSVLPLSEARAGTAASAGEELERGGSHRFKSWGIRNLRSGNLNTGAPRRNSAIDQFQARRSGTKGVSKAATLCHNFDSEMPCRRARPTTNAKPPSLLPPNSFGKIVDRLPIRQMVGFERGRHRNAGRPTRDGYNTLSQGSLSRSTPSRPAQATGTGPARSAS